MAKPTSPPSPALLSVLATIASSSTAIEGPAPPSFLCPCLNNKSQIPSATISPSPPGPQRIPPKYELGDDGLWRRAESYSLYGLTVTCTSACSYPTQMPTHLSSFSDDELQVPDSYTSSPNPTSTEDIRDSLPLGWKPGPPQNSSRATLILALSLLLALFICFFIIGCLFWRKSIIKRRKRDLEAEFKKHHSVPSAAEEAKALADKETKAKQKILARAAARWKANVRHAVRQRRGKRVASSISSQAHQSSLSSSDSHSQLTLSVSLSPSRTTSRRSSLISQPDDPPQPIIGELPDTISPMTTSPHTNVPISPPAYHHGGQVPPVVYSNTSNASTAHRSRCSSQSSSFRVRIDPHGASTPKPFHAAHVATDDKALLARLAHLTSRPPEDASTDTLDTHISAPAWPDELEEIPPDLITSNDHPPDITCVPSSLFPPPPSMERTAAADHYEYSFSFEDMVALEPEPGPSAPPFQLDSALLDDHQNIPSAPPLMDDTELFVDVHPSAPQWESTLGLGEENPTGQDHDRITLAEVPLSGLPPPTNIQPVSTSRQEFGMIDDVTLPGYRP